MPLSDHEQRLLEQMERALYAEDPKFVAALQHRSERSASRRQRVLAVLVALGGLGALLGGVSTGIVPVGVCGFVLLLLAVFLLLRTPRVRGGADAVTAPAPEARKQRGFIGRMEQRWDRRSDDGD